MERRPAFALTAIVGVSFLARTGLAWLRSTPGFFPDEYIYSAIGRSLADSGRPSIRGGSAHFPALLQPILTAPAWLIGDVGTAFRAVQAIGALAMSLAAIPVYVLAVRLGLSRRIALACAALAVLVPDLLYSSFVSSEPFAYPLVLAAAAAATVALAEPSRRAQLAFVAFAALAALTRAQLAVLPVLFVLAALVLGALQKRVRSALREQLLPIGAFLVPLVAVGLAGTNHVLGYYRSVLHLQLHPIVFLRWSGWDAMVLAYAAGWIIVPGALLGLWFALRRPTSRLEQSFAVVAVLLTATLVAEAGLMQANAAGRAGVPVIEIKERYVFYVVPLAGVAFALYARRGWPARLPHLVLAAALLVLSVRIPLSGFAISTTISASPILFGVYWLTVKLGGPGNAAGLVAATVGVMSVVAVLASRRPRLGTPIVLGLALLATGVASAGAVALDVANSSLVRKTTLPSDPSWVDRAHVGQVTLLQSALGSRSATLQELFWNRSITRAALLPGATRFDVFRTQAVRVADDGSLTVNGRPLGGPLLVDRFGSTVRLWGARELESGPTATLWVPDRLERPRLRLYAQGVYHDGWLADRGAVYLWPRRTGGRLSGWISMRLTAPEPLGAIQMTFTLPDGRVLRARVRPGRAQNVRLAVCRTGRARITYRSNVRALTGLRVVGAQATPPVFTPGRAACRFPVA
ncbi:MAG: hypothetical protein ACM3QU_15645 [Verrucomicrobiota bacterium]